MLSMIITGGQTGVDRAALDAAMAAGIEVGGWCPPGREAEDGPIPLKYHLKEAPMDASPAAPGIPRSLRTEWNVRDSDATLIIISEKSASHDPGTQWTIKCAIKYRKPHLKIIADDADAKDKIKCWIAGNAIKVLNIAGLPESKEPGLYLKTFDLLTDLFKELRNKQYQN